MRKSKKDKRENEKNLQEGGMECYKEEIFEMVGGIGELGTMEYVHRFLELFLGEWGQ